MSLHGGRKTGRGTGRGEREGSLGLALAVAVLSVVVATGCTAKPELVEPETLVTPYESRELVWAVAPLSNESGTTAVEPLVVSDELVATLTQVRGLSALPMDRTIGAMVALEMPQVRTPADARRLAEALGADGLVVGSITAYDPYDPPKVGLALALYGRGEGMASGARVGDPQRLRTAVSDIDMLSRWGERPLSVVNEHYDGANHAVGMELERYATGREREESALGWRGHLASAELFTRFAAYASVRRLLEAERSRVAALEPTGPGAAKTVGGAEGRASRGLAPEERWER